MCLLNVVEVCGLSADINVSVSKLVNHLCFTRFEFDYFYSPPSLANKRFWGNIGLSLSICLVNLSKFLLNG